MATPIDRSPPQLEHLIRNARSVLELAAAVGDACLDHKDEIKRLKKNADATLIQEELEARIRWLDETGELQPGGDGTFAHLFDIEEFEDRIERAETFPPIGHFAILRGLLRPLGRIFESETGVVELERGLPIPIAERPVHTLFPTTTPRQQGTADQLLLLPKSGFHVFGFGADPEVPVQLDFSVRKRLDELTWTKEKRLPRVATVHPRLGRDGVRITEEGDGWFFGVTPAEWNLDPVLDQLRTAARAGAEIAVLPELCLPEAELDALEAALASSAKQLPPLVVAGSVHVKEQKGGSELRANEARIFLDGERVGSHRKINPYNLNVLPDGRRLEHPMQERLSEEIRPITLLSGTYTRMAVMICSDLISELPVQLQDAGVNLLLVPALTPKAGTFNGDVCNLASHCQGVAVIVNADTSLYKGVLRRPFMVMAAVPRERPREQSREYRRRFRGGPAVGLLDPNRRLRRALRWL